MICKKHGGDKRRMSEGDKRRMSEDKTGEGGTNNKGIRWLHKMELNQMAEIVGGY